MIVLLILDLSVTGAHLDNKLALQGDTEAPHTPMRNRQAQTANQLRSTKNGMMKWQIPVSPIPMDKNFLLLQLLEKYPAGNINIAIPIK